MFDDNRAAAIFDRLPQLLNDNAFLVRRGAFFDARFQVGIGAVPFDIGITSGRLTAFERGPFLMRSWRFAIRGTAEAWMRLWQPAPEPGWHDIFALTKRGAMTIDGDLWPVMANLQYLKDLLALPRGVTAEAKQ
jgi:hypothetical protein